MQPASFTTNASSVIQTTFRKRNLINLIVVSLSDKDIFISKRPGEFLYKKSMINLIFVINK